MQSETRIDRSPEWNAIFSALRDYRMSNMRDDIGGGYPLVDLMSNDGERIATGEEEMALLADEISIALSAAPSPPAGGGEPVAWRWKHGHNRPSDPWALSLNDPREALGAGIICEPLSATSPDAAQQRIRELEEALEVSRHANDVFSAYGCPVCNGDCAAANPPVMGCPMALTQDADRRARTAGGSADE